MSARTHRQALDFIRANRNPDGGWGYRPGRKSLVEPTSFCLLALLSAGEKDRASKGLDFLKSCQLPSGAIGLSPEDTEGNWMSYAALLAFNALGAEAEKRRSLEWILSMDDASSRFSREDVSTIKRVYRYDASIQGWPWTPGTTAWVEPTALFVIALTRAGIPSTHKRIKSGVALILDRTIPSGGWNFGNAYSKSHELEPNTISTALALAALHRAGVSGSLAPVAAGIRFLSRSLSEDISAAALAWSLLALESYATASSQVLALAGRLAGFQSAEGGFNRDLFVTALSVLVLNDSPLLEPIRRKG